MRTLPLVSLLLLIWVNAVPVHASFPGVVSVVQPIELDGPGLVTVTVTYVGYQLIWDDPGVAIMLTTQPNQIWYDGKARDLNTATLVGIRFLREDSRHSTARQQWPGVHGDTLDVIVDLSRYNRNAEMGQYENFMVITTLACGLRNARIRWPQIRYVNYNVTGNDSCQHLSGVYPLEHVEAPEQASQPDIRRPAPVWFRRNPR